MRAYLAHLRGRIRAGYRTMKYLGTADGRVFTTEVTNPPIPQDEVIVKVPDDGSLSVIVPDHAPSEWTDYIQQLASGHEKVSVKIEDSPEDAAR